MSRIDPHIFVALYIGQTIGQAKIVGASTDPELVSLATQRMLAEQGAREAQDGVSEALDAGRLCALKLIRGKTEAKAEVPAE